MSCIAAWVKVESDGLVLEDAVDRFFLGFKLFLQGLGHGKERWERSWQMCVELFHPIATGLGTVLPQTSGSFIKAIQLQQSVLSTFD